MDRAPLPRQQVGVERLAEQGVAQRHHAVGLDDQQLGLGRLVEGGVELGRSQLHVGRAAAGGDDLGEQRGRDPLAGHGDDPQQLRRAGSAVAGAPDQHLAQARRQGVGVAGERGPHQGFSDVRVPTGPGMDPRDQVGAQGLLRVAAEQVAELLADLVVAQRPERDLDDSAGPSAVGQPLAEQVTRLVGTVGDDDGEPLLVERRAEEGQHLEGRDIGEVQVVDDEQGGPQLGGAVEDGGHRRDQPGLVAGRLGPRAELGEEQRQVAGVGAEDPGDVVPGQPGQQRAQRRDERRIGDPAAEEAHAGAAADDRAPRHPADELVEQPGLAGPASPLSRARPGFPSAATVTRSASRESSPARPTRPGSFGTGPTVPGGRVPRQRPPEVPEPEI